MCLLFKLEENKQTELIAYANRLIISGLVNHCEKKKLIDASLVLRKIVQRVTYFKLKSPVT